MAEESIVVGQFTPPEFKVVRRRLERGGVTFDVDCDTSAPGINDQGLFCERATVMVFVHTKEAALAAARIIDEWRLETGHMDRKNRPTRR